MHIMEWMLRLFKIPVYFVYVIIIFFCSEYLPPLCAARAAVVADCLVRLHRRVREKAFARKTGNNRRGERVSDDSKSKRLKRKIS